MLLDENPHYAARWRTYYHVTNRQNVPAIRAHGLDPYKSLREAQRVWLADLAVLPWAIGHVSRSHGWTMGEIVILRITLPVGELTTHRSGVYYTRARIPARFVGFGLACQY